MRLLAELDCGGSVAATPAVAEQLGEWVRFTDAIALSAVLNPGSTPVASASSTRTGMRTGTRTATGAEALEKDVAQTRRDLVSLITRTGKLPHGKAPIPLPDAPDNSEVRTIAFEPYRRFHTAHQRELESSLGALRVRIRTAVSGKSARHQQLAALDTVMHAVLDERASRLLNKVASLLQKRFLHLWNTETQHPQTPNPGWLNRFLQEQQAVLLAELDLRLQPALGLLEAYQNEN